MKKNILLSIVSLAVLSTSSLSAYYDDYKYKKHIKKGYQFGFNFGTAYTLKYKDTYIFSGIDTKYVKEFGRSGINAGVSGGLQYNTKHVRGDSPTIWNIEPRLGTDLLYKNLNVYVGFGLDGWENVETVYDTIGLDYYYSEDIIFNFSYKSKIENYRSVLSDGSSMDFDHRFGISVTIPFNHY